MSNKMLIITSVLLNSYKDPIGAVFPSIFGGSLTSESLIQLYKNADSLALPSLIQSGTLEMKNLTLSFENTSSG